MTLINFTQSILPSFLPSSLFCFLPQSPYLLKLFHSKLWEESQKKTMKHNNLACYLVQNLQFAVCERAVALILWHVIAHNFCEVLKCHIMFSVFYIYKLKTHFPNLEIEWAWTLVYTLKTSLQKLGERKFPERHYWLLP